MHCIYEASMTFILPLTCSVIRVINGLHRRPPPIIIRSLDPERTERLLSPRQAVCICMNTHVDMEISVFVCQIIAV